MSLGTLSAGTTEAHVDDMMMVLEVADEATPTPIRPRPEMALNSNPLILYGGGFPRCVCHTHTRVTSHRPLPSGVSVGRRGRVIVRTLGGGSSTTP